jgi:hypothetical protein
MGWRMSPAVLALSFSIAAFANISLSFAQAGSTGGTIGKQDKSVSGEEDIRQKPGPVRRANPNHSNPSHRVSPMPSGRGSVTLYNGTWNGVSTGHCIAAWTWTLQVSNGVISGSGTNGRVTEGGGINGVMVVLGTAYNFVGHLNPKEASGTWTSRPGCFGGWTATKS